MIEDDFVFSQHKKDRKIRIVLPNKKEQIEFMTLKEVENLLEHDKIHNQGWFISFLENEIRYRKILDRIKNATFL